ncbi:MAG: amidohydrolase [Gammaproteobacteria bacterium]|nr:amidohydrolase [Gammaproteobacteria bacterium]
MHKPKPIPARMLATVLLALLPAGCVGMPQQPAADRVFLNGAVYTVNPAQPWAEAVAIRAGAIVYVGDDAGAQSLIDTRTVVSDLRGRMLLPGFHDGHAHVLAGGMSLSSCDLEDRRDHEWIRARLAQCSHSDRFAADGWITGAHWALAAFADGSPPKAWLDESFGSRPAYFVDSFSHSAWVNTRALELAGIDRDTPNPPHGVIERDPLSGQATGVLRDAAMELVARHVPEPGAAELAASVAAGVQQANSFGITAFVEPGLTREYLAPYVNADRAGTLNARVTASLSPIGWDSGRFGPEIFELLAERGNFRGPRLNVDSVKVYIDGVMETGTAHLLEPYSDGSNFEPFYSTAELNELYPRLDALGVQIHTHAIGDGAIRMALDAYAQARKLNPSSDNRHQIVHLQLIDETDIPRFAELDVAADFQSLWAYPDDYFDMALPLLGAPRVNRYYPIASVQRSGGRIVGGSDWDVSSLNPLDAIETAVRRQDPFTADGPVLQASERVDLATMIEAYTRNAAWVMRLDTLSGSVEVGKRADLIVLDRNLFAIPATEINQARVLLTLLDGVEMYRAAMETRGDLSSLHGDGDR